MPSTLEFTAVIQPLGLSRFVVSYELISSDKGSHSQNTELSIGTNEKTQTINEKNLLKCNVNKI